MATFNLTTGIDTITGTAANDEFEGRNGNTLQTGDVIDGGAGSDFLVANTDRNGTPAPTISNVEYVWLTTGGQPVSLRDVSGVNYLATERSSIVLEDVGADDLSTRFSARLVESGTVQLRFEGGALEAPNDTLNLRSVASNVTFTSDSTFDSTADGEQNRTEDALRIEAVSLQLLGGRPQAEFDNQVDLSDFRAITELTLFGRANSKVTIDSPELETIDARFTTGGVTVTSDIAGDQTVFGGTGDDDFKTGAGNDTVKLGAGDDILMAGGGDNTVFGGAGDDEITSEQGRDRIWSGEGDDTINSGSGDDLIRGGAGADEIMAGDGADNAAGGDGDDVIDGQGGADRLSDGAGNDRVRGGSDNDILFMGQGDDTFLGEGGEDTFIFRGTDLGSDVVEDFTLTGNAATNDTVFFDFEGSLVRLTSQQEFEDFFDANRESDRVSVDQGTSTFTVLADGGTLELNVTDTDFLFA